MSHFTFYIRPIYMRCSDVSEFEHVYGQTPFPSNTTKRVPRGIYPVIDRCTGWGIQRVSLRAADGSRPEITGRRCHVITSGYLCREICLCLARERLINSLNKFETSGFKGICRALICFNTCLYLCKCFYAKLR